MFKRFLALTLLALASNACVTAMSKQDLDSIKSIQVLTSLEDKFFITDKGLTVFENDAFDGDISAWKLRQRSLDRLQAALPAGTKVVEVKNIPVDTKVAEGWNALAENLRADAKAKGADTVLLLTRDGFYNSAGGGFWEVHPKRGGFGFFSKSLFGKTILTCPFFSYHLSLYRVADGKFLTSGQEAICVNQNQVEQVLQFSQYPQEAKDFFRKTLENAIDEKFSTKVKSLFKAQAAASQGL